MYRRITTTSCGKFCFDAERNLFSLIKNLKGKHLNFDCVFFEKNMEESSFCVSVIMSSAFYF
jgi:hypothetical protein